MKNAKTVNDEAKPYLHDMMQDNQTGIVITKISKEFHALEVAAGAVDGVDTFGMRVDAFITDALSKREVIQSFTVYVSDDDWFKLSKNMFG